MKKNYLIIIVCAFFACKQKHHSPMELFSVQEDLFEIQCHFNEDSLGMIEAIQCNASSLIVFDYHSGNSFTLFDLQSENTIGRFGEIGQGPGEIPLGCYGYLNDSEFTINDDHTGLIAKYPVDSLRANIRFKPLRLVKYEIPEAQFSRVIPVNDTLFWGAGTYRSKFQFVLFDDKSNIIDFNVEIYNAEDQTFNVYHKYLANQGILKKHPKRNKYVYAVNYSSNIDFVELLNDQIQWVKSIRLRNPENKPVQDGMFNRVLPDTDNPIGYIDISTSNHYVYALYTDKQLVGDDGQGNSFSSSTVLVFDWDGNPVKILKLNHETYYIAISENLGKMYAAIQNKDYGWSITAYKLN